LQFINFHKNTILSKTTIAYIQLHIAVFLFGFTAILGKLISLEGLILVAYRIAITIVSLLIILGGWKKIGEIPRQDIKKLIAIGILVGLHWTTFFASIKVSNISIALSCLAASPFFTSIIEPIFMKRKIRFSEIILASMVVLGFAFIFDMRGKFLLGMILGILSALGAATFSVMNKTIVDKYEPFSIMLVEFLAGFAFLIALCPLYLYFFPNTKLIPSASDWGYLLILALLCTTFAYTLSILALKYVSAFTSSLTINLEPVYGILFAYWGFDESKELSTNFYIGTGIVLLSVFLNPLINKVLNLKTNNAAE
jgi:drug/metabolite transporter (DMT)-like permease